MFGYHDSNRCEFDLWSPTRHCAADNRGFSAYAFNQTELDNLVDQICAEYRRTGETNFTITKSLDFTDADIAYIQREVQRRIG